MDVAKDFTNRYHLQNQSFFVVTSQQTNGRGRLGRVWSQSSINDKNTTIFSDTLNTPKNTFVQKINSFDKIYNHHHDVLPFTFALHASALKIPMEWISLMAGVALYDALISTVNTIRLLFSASKISRMRKWGLFLKWPNDLIWQDESGNLKKLSGILCETQVHEKSDLSTRGFTHIYIGIGLNFFSSPNVLNADAFFKCLFSESILQSLKASERKIIINKFFKYLTVNFKKYLSQTHSITHLQKYVLNRMFPVNTKLSISENNLIGRFTGLNKHGALLLGVSKGIEKTIYSTDSINIIKDTKNLVCIDFGNTRIHLTARNEYLDERNEHFSYDDLTQPSLYNKFKKIINLFNLRFINHIEIIYVSVNTEYKTKHSLRYIKDIFKKNLNNKKLTFLKISSNQIFQNTKISPIFDKETLGADRALKCIFAFQKSLELKKNVLIFSFGTATTCEGFTQNGEMIENFVFPGLQMTFDALHEFTALLPKINAKKINFVSSPKYWTQKLYIIRGAIINLVSSIIFTSKLHSPCHVYLTGGNAKEIHRILIEIIPDELKENMCTEVTENMETKMLADLYESFR